MANQFTGFEFTEPGFVVGSDAVVFLVRLSELRSFISLRELEEAFSGYASYRQTPWLTRYVGVWVRKNSRRLRRFMRERGAEITLIHERPQRLRLGGYVTHQSRAKVRSLDQVSEARDGS